MFRCVFVSVSLLLASCCGQPVSEYPEGARQIVCRHAPSLPESDVRDTLVTACVLGDTVEQICGELPGVCLRALRR